MRFRELLQLGFEMSGDFCLAVDQNHNILPNSHLIMEINSSFLVRAVAKPLIGI